MADGDQERFGDYLELEDYIDALQAGKVAHPPPNLTLEQIRIYQMAALFHSGADKSEQPRPEFIAQLKSQLLDLSQEQETSASAQVAAEPIPEGVPQEESVVPQPPAPTKAGSIRRVRFFSRRGLLAGGAIAAASLVVGAGMDHMKYANSAPDGTSKNTSYPTNNNNYPVSANQQLNIGHEIPTTWHFVTSLANLGKNAVRFTSETMVGYVLRGGTYPDGSRDPDDETILALSAACTHMGCLVQWKSTERHFLCPCHEAIFGEEGTLKPTGYQYPLPPLPRLNVKIENGNVYVELPYPR
jgi:Rieske Fe-S protein